MNRGDWYYDGGPFDPIDFKSLTAYEAANLFAVLGICFFMSFNLTLAAIWTAFF